MRTFGALGFIYQTFCVESFGRETSILPFLQKIRTRNHACLYLRIACDHYYGHACRKYDASGPEVEEAWNPQVFERRLRFLLFMRLSTNSTCAWDSRSKLPTDAFKSIDSQ